MKLATIKLYIDAEAFESDSNGEVLTDTMLSWLGELLNEQACPIYGYSGWEVGWVTCPQ